MYFETEKSREKVENTGNFVLIGVWQPCICIFVDHRLNIWESRRLIWPLTRPACFHPRIFLVTPRNPMPWVAVTQALLPTLSVVYLQLRIHHSLQIMQDITKNWTSYHRYFQYVNLVWSGLITNLFHSHELKYPGRQLALQHYHEILTLCLDDILLWTPLSFNASALTDHVN